MYSILVAEDELLERKVLCKFLKRSMEDRCTVLEAGNGREAVALFESTIRRWRSWISGCRA